MVISPGVAIHALFSSCCQPTHLQQTEFPLQFPRIVIIRIGAAFISAIKSWIWKTSIQLPHVCANPRAYSDDASGYLGLEPLHPIVVNGNCDVFNGNNKPY